MNASARHTPTSRSPIPPAHHPGPSFRPRRADSSSSEESPTSSNVYTFPAHPRSSPYSGPQPDSRAAAGTATPPRANVAPAQNFSRPSIALSQNSEHNSSRAQSPSIPPNSGYQHQRKHSQGFFEPSLPTASLSSHQASHNPSMPNLAASQAAQAAMQQQQQQQQHSHQHMRKRSQTAPGAQSPPERITGRRKPSIPPPIQTTQSHHGAIPAISTPNTTQHPTGMLLNHGNAAATAASAAYPRSAHSSPSYQPPDLAPSVPEKDSRQKSEKSKMKLFSKPKSIGIVKERDGDRKDRGLPSPNKSQNFGQIALPRMANASTTSLADTLASTTSSSIYGTANNSTATLVPNDKNHTSERHRHHFLSRQKNKLKEKDDHHYLPLSSASSNSKPLDPAAPQSLYSFTPSSPSPASTSFAKTMSGLDLRHGGRALREKKKEEKSSTQALKDPEGSFPGLGDWHGPSSLAASQSSSFLAPTLANATPTHNAGMGFSDVLGPVGLQGIGLSGMTADDAWPFLKAKLLMIFEGEELREPIEDFNRLVT